LGKYAYLTRSEIGEGGVLERRDHSLQERGEKVGLAHLLKKKGGRGGEKMHRKQSEEPDRDILSWTQEKEGSDGDPNAQRRSLSKSRQD